MSRSARSWLEVWGDAAYYWAPSEVYSELSALGYIDRHEITDKGREALKQSSD